MIRDKIRANFFRVTPPIHGRNSEGRNSEGVTQRIPTYGDSENIPVTISLRQSFAVSGLFATRSFESVRRHAHTRMGTITP